jgi:hypothetical protein
MEQGTRSLVNGGSQMDRFEGLLAKASPKIRQYLLDVGFQSGMMYVGSGQTIDFKPDVWLARLDELPDERKGTLWAELRKAGLQPTPKVH